MRILFTSIFLFSLFTSFTQQDTISVQTFTYDSISTRRAIFDFPAELQGKTFEKVLMYYNLKCDPATPWDSYDCGEWDYLAHSKIHDHTGVLDSTLVEGPHHLVNNDWAPTISYTNSPYYNYYQSYQYFINYSVQSETDYSIGSAGTQTEVPFASSNTYGHSQLLWTAAELSAAGLTAGSIDKLRFNFITDAAELGNLKIRMKHTSSSVVNVFEDGGWTSVYHKNTDFAGTGIQTINLTTAFNYDGSSNLLIDIAFENGTAGTDHILTATQTTSNTVVQSTEKLGYLSSNQTEFLEVNLSDYDFGNEVTVSFWANGDGSILPVNTSIVEAGDSLNNRLMNVHFPWSNSRHYWDAGEGSGYDRIDKAASGTEISGGWHHWAFTKNATTGEMNIYKDGILWHSGTNKDRLVGIVNSLKIGINRAKANGWPGWIDEFRIWDVALNQTEITNWMNTKVDNTHPNFADLVLYYDFDGEQSVIDQSGNNRDAMMSDNSMITFSSDSKAGYTLSDLRPDITFVQGTYTSTIDSTLVTDSAMAAPIDIMSYAVNGRKFVVDSLIHVYPEGYSYTYDASGSAIDSTFFGATVSFANDSIFYYEEPYEVIDPFEIGRFITPYGIGFDLGPNGFTYVYDVTDYQELLQGSVDFQAHNTQELIDIQFKFIVGTPPREVIGVEKIWGNHGSHTYADLDNDVKLPAKDILLDANGEMFKIRTRITGHGHHGSNNCCEWGNGQGRDHELLLDGVSRFTWDIWQETECGDNPNTGQGGTWPYAREGWCPGDIVEDHEFDISPYVSAGNTVSIDYDIEDVPANDQAQGNGNYNMSMHLVTYGEANFSNDAAVVDVLNPNKWEYYGKWNPTCQNPRIILKNNGSTALTKCNIHIWVGDFDNVIDYEWTGNLEFLEEEVVEIPVTPEWWADWEGQMTFSAMTSEPNDVTDEYEANNKRSVEFEATPVYNEPFYVWFQTNNKAAENNIFIKDQDGNIVYERNSLNNSTEYKDTLDLPQGCYTLELHDSDHDGLGYWYSNQTEGETTGFLRLREVNGGMLKIFQSDFGRYTSHSFSVGYALNTEEKEQSYELSVFPNPNKGQFSLTMDNFKGSQVSLSVMNELGQTVFSKNLNTNDDGFYKHDLNLTNIPGGIYYLRVMSDEQTAVKQIVIQ